MAMPPTKQRGRRSRRLLFGRRLRSVLAGRAALLAHHESIGRAMIAQVELKLDACQVVTDGLRELGSSAEGTRTAAGGCRVPRARWVQATWRS
jgi:hypothetical protein